jgi:hypothetical protein
VSIKHGINSADVGNEAITKYSFFPTIVLNNLALRRLSFAFCFTKEMVLSKNWSYDEFSGGLMHFCTKFCKSVGWSSIKSGKPFSSSFLGLGNFIMLIIMVSLLQGHE